MLDTPDFVMNIHSGAKRYPVRHPLTWAWGGIIPITQARPGWYVDNEGWLVEVRRDGARYWCNHHNPVAEFHAKSTADESRWLRTYRGPIPVTACDAGNGVGIIFPESKESPHG